MRTRPIGTLIQKIHCHDRPSITAPPTSGPRATARPPMPPHAPSARPRRSAGTAALRIVSVSGATMAPPRPCSARAATSASIDGASAASADAAVKIPRPIDEHAPPPEPVTERGAGEQEDGERQRVRVDRPLETLDRRVEVGADHRQRRRHDEVVEHDHDERQRRDDERPEASCGRSCSPSSSSL